MSATAVLQGIAQSYDPSATHVMRGAYDAGYHSGRLLKNEIGDQSWYIVRVSEVGKIRRGALHTTEVRIYVARHRWGDSL
jgi:hypothetical protein